MNKLKSVLVGVIAVSMIAVILATGAFAAGFSRTKAYKQNQFADVKENSWFNESVKNVYELGLMNGTADDKFSPSGMFTFAEALTISARLHSIYNGGDGVIPKAAKGEWYQGAVEYCIKNGIIYDGQIEKYSDNITRAEMAGIIVKALPDSEWASINKVEELPDVTVATPSNKDIFKLYNAGVVSGSDEYGKYTPYAYITRAEVATIVSRVAEPSLRKTFTLKKYSALNAPELPSSMATYSMTKQYSYSRDIRIMSNGMIPVAESELFGYYNNNGEMVVPYIYTEAENFKDGYAIVRKDKLQGVINTKGEYVIPLTENDIYRNEDVSGLFSVYDTKNGTMRIVRPGIFSIDNVVVREIYDDYIMVEGGSNFNLYGVITMDGKEVIPSKYDRIDYNGIYFIGSVVKEERGEYDDEHLYEYHIYDLSGKLLKTLEGDGYIDNRYNNTLLGFSKDGKYGLASTEGIICDADYDSVWPVNNSNIAELNYANKVFLSGENGIFFEGNRDELDCLAAWGNYALMCDLTDYTLFIIDINGERRDTKVSYDDDLRYKLIEVTEEYFIYEYGILVRFNGTTYWYAEKVDLTTGERVDESKVSVVSIDGNEMLCLEEKAVEGNYTAYLLNDGRWYFGLTHEFYSSYEAVEAAAENYVRAYVQERCEETRKPRIVISDVSGEIVDVIEYAKEPFYYDDMVYLGENCYAGKYKEKWYLITI